MAPVLYLFFLNAFLDAIISGKTDKNVLNMFKNQMDSE